MPEVTGMSITDAKKALKELGLEVEIIGEGETVGDQLPKTGIKINSFKYVVCNKNSHKGFYILMSCKFVIYVPYKGVSF